jgi:hypothetical protein
MDITETQRQNRETIQTTQNPYYTRQEEPPVRSMSPGGRKFNPPVGDVLWGLGPPGKAMTEEVMVEDPGPRGEGHTPQGQEHEGRRKYLPRGLRIRLFDEVNRLRRDGLTYLEIIGWIWRRYGVKISK